MENEGIKLPETPQEIYEVLADGTNIKVFYASDRPPEILKIRKISRENFPVLADAILGDISGEYPEAGCYGGRDAVWAKSLSEESFEAVMQEGRRLNFTRFGAWFERRQAVIDMTKVTAPMLAKVQETVQKALAKRPQT
jgi:hypothetical protein